MSDDIYYDLHMEEDNEPEKSRGAKIASFFFKSLFWIVLICIMGILIYRMVGMREPSMADDFLANDKTIAGITESKNDKISDEYSSLTETFRDFDNVILTDRDSEETKSVSIKDYGYDGFQVFSQHLTGYYLYNEETDEYETVERSEYFNEKDHVDEGSLKISNAYFMPQSKQICVTFRYNGNALDNLLAMYPAAASLDEKLIFKISDNLGNVYDEYSYIKGERQKYTYRRLLFDDISFSGVKTLSLDIYYPGDTEAPYRSMIIYDCNLTLDIKNISLPSSANNNLIACKKAD